MRLKKSRNTSDEQLIAVLNSGYHLLNWLKTDYDRKRTQGTYDPAQDHQKYTDRVNQWGQTVIETLNSIFPTELEANQFLRPPQQFGAVAADSTEEYKAKSLRTRLDDLVRGLDDIRKNALIRYTDLPITTRLYVEDIDSFAKVRDVNPSMVAHLLKDGCLDMAEDSVKMGLEQILDVPFHRKDSPAELDDIYTANVIVNGGRRATALMLKGPGIGTKEMDVKHCGSKGNQLVRLFDAPADVFVVQFTGRIAEMVIKDVDGKVAALHARGKETHFLIMDGQDTARVLLAYGKL